MSDYQDAGALDTEGMDDVEFEGAPGRVSVYYEMDSPPYGGATDVFAVWLERVIRERVKDIPWIGKEIPRNTGLRTHSWVIRAEVRYVHWDPKPSEDETGDPR